VAVRGFCIPTQFQLVALRVGAALMSSSTVVVAVIRLAKLNGLWVSRTEVQLGPDNGGTPELYLWGVQMRRRLSAT
jgi:hypothetical protein